jgi:hypothetical protein
MSEPLLNSNGARSSEDQEYSEDISLDNSWVPTEKGPSCFVSLLLFSFLEKKGTLY